METGAGWIKIYYKIRKHWIFENAAYLKAWITMLMEVNYQEKKVLIESKLFICKRGESLNSLKTWARVFGKGWTIRKVRTFFSLLENDGMIKRKNERKTTRLIICKYDSYQKVRHADDMQTTCRRHADDNN